MTQASHTEISAAGHRRAGRFAVRNLIVAALGLLLLPAAAFTASGLVDQPAPDFALKSFAGKNLRLSEYRGEVVLVTFWASWCGRCREQLAELTELHAHHHDQDFQLLSVSLDDKPDRAQDVIDDLRIEFPVLRDDKKTVARLYDPDTMPLTIIVDHGGTVRHVHEGYRQGDEALYQTELMALLAE
jgi:peroxiredoxin